MTNPLPVFHFQVEWGGSRVGFSEVSGLDQSIEVIEYREGSSPVRTPKLIPGLARPATVTLKRGIMPKDNELFDWIRTSLSGAVERRDLVVSLLDTQHEPAMVWKLKSAWPTKLEAPTLDAFANEIAIETLEIVCEGLTTETP